MKNYMKQINQNINMVILFLLFGCTLKPFENRISVSNIRIGDKLEEGIFDTIKDNILFDFPYLEVSLKTDENIILYIVGDENIVYRMRQINISNDTCNLFCSKFSEKLGVKPNYRKDSLVSGIWNCLSYTWLDTIHKDNISLSNCVNKNNSLPENKRWELLVENDSVYYMLLKKYIVVPAR